MQNEPRNNPTQPTPGDPTPSTPPTQPTPGDPNPNKTKTAQPSRPDVEINPGKVGNNTEVDLDTTKIKTYPDKKTSEKI